MKIRVFRDGPFCWQDKRALRLIKRVYKGNKLVKAKAIYLVLTEIESDFGEHFVQNFVKTVATYSGVPRSIVSHFLKELERQELIMRTDEKDKRGRYVSRQIKLLAMDSSDGKTDSGITDTIETNSSFSKEDNTFKKEYEKQIMEENSTYEYLYDWLGRIGAKQPEYWARAHINKYGPQKVKRALNNINNFDKPTISDFLRELSDGN